jgi:hypothetical protein
VGADDDFTAARAGAGVDNRHVVARAAVDQVALAVAGVDAIDNFTVRAGTVTDPRRR